MIRMAFAPMALLLFFTAAAHAGYADLNGEIAAYQPPAYLLDRPENATPETVSPEDGDFESALAGIEALRKQWMQSVDGRPASEVFLRPMSLQIAALSAAAPAKTLEDRLDLSELEVLTLARNPGVRAAENRFRAAVESFGQVASLDEILRQYTAYTDALKTGVGPEKGRDPVGMKFPFPGVLALKGQVVDQQVRAARESLEIAKRESVTAVRKVFWDLGYTRRAQAIVTRMIVLLDRLESVAVTRYEAGKTSFQDVIKIRIKRETIRESRVSLREGQRNAETGIRELLDLDRGVRLGRPGDENPVVVTRDLDTLFSLARERRQELRRLRFRIGKMERMIEMAETMILPSYSQNYSLYAGAAADTVGTAAGKAPFASTVTAARGAGLPKMPWYGTDDAYLRETRQKLRALKAELRNAEAATDTAVRRAWSEQDRYMREFGLYRRTVLQLTRAALDVTTRGYEAGGVAFADVIDAYTQWLDANLALARRRADVGTAAAELQRAVGVSLAGTGGSERMKETPALSRAAGEDAHE